MLPNPAATRQSVLKQLGLPPRVEGGGSRRCLKKTRSVKPRTTEKYRNRGGDAGSIREFAVINNQCLVNT